MGKDKKERVKGNLKPAASSRAAELLSTEGRFGAGLLPSLSSTAGFGANQTADDDFLEIDSELKVIFKKLLKRDTITRVKALEEFHTYLNGDKTAQDFVQALSAWPKLFNKLSIDSDRRVRESTFLVHLTLVKGLPKRQAILPYLKDIIGSWICGKFDGSKEVVKYATESFEECFPNKRTEAFAFCQSEILRFCFENALNSTPETLSDPRFTSAEDMASKFGRVVSGCVAMMALLLDTLEFQELEKCQKKYDEFFSNDMDSTTRKTTFWKLLSHGQPSIRRSAYKLITTVSREWTDLIRPSQDLIAYEFLCTVFNDRDSVTHTELWESVVVVSEKFPDVWLIASQAVKSDSDVKSGKKSAVTKLYQFLKSGGFSAGSAMITYPSLLPTVAYMPKEMTCAANSTFPAQFLSSIWKGLESATFEPRAVGTITNMSVVLLKSYHECLLWLISNRSNMLGVVEDSTLNALLVPIRCILTNEDELARARLQEADIIEKQTEAVVKFTTSEKLTDEIILKYLQAFEELALKVSNIGVKADTSSDAARFVQHCSILSDLITSTLGNLTDRSVQAGRVGQVKSQLSRLARSLALSALDGLPDPSGSSLVLGRLRLVDGLLRFGAIDCYHDHTIIAALDNLVINTLPKLVRTHTNDESDEALLVALEISSWWICHSSADHGKGIWSSVVITCSNLEPEKGFKIIATLIKSLANDRLTEKSLLGDTSDAEIFAGKGVELLFAIPWKSQVGQLSDEPAGLFIAELLKANQGLSLISPESVSAVVSRLLAPLRQLAKHVRASDVHDESDGTHSTDAALWSLLILDTVFKESSSESHFSRTAHDVLRGVIAIVFELAHFTLETNIPATTATTIHSLAKSIWGSVQQSLAGKKMEETFLRSSDIVPVLVKSWEAAFLDVTHTASPVEFVEAISNIISASTTNDQRSHVLETACQTQAFWQRQHEAFTSTFTIRPDHLRSCALIVDPSSSLFLSKRSGEENTQIEVRYDPNGLSLYARVALTVIGLVRALGSEASSLVWVPSLVNRSWLLLELLKLRIIMDDYSAVSSPFLSDNEANLIEPWLWQSQNGSTLIDVQLFRNDVLAAVDNVLDLVVPKNLSTDVVVDVLKYLERRAVSDKNDFAHAILASAISRGQEIYGDESRVVKLLIQGLDKVRGNQFTSAIGASVARSMTSGNTRALYPILLAAQKSMLKSDVEHTCNFCLEQAVSAKDFSRDGLLHLSVLDCMLTECRNRQEQGRSIGLGNTQLAQKVVKAARRYLENTASEIDEAVEIECVEFLQNVLWDAPSAVDLGSASWLLSSFISWLSTAAAAEGTLTPFARVKLHKTLKLASAITKVSRERSDTWRELSDEYWEHIFRIFVRECGPQEGIVIAAPFQVAICQLVARLVGEAREEIVFNNIALEEASSLLYTPCSQVQLVAYSISRRIVRLHVQELSLQLEMVQEDEEPEPVTVDDGVVAGVVKAVPKFEHEAVEEDKLSAHEALGYLLSWKLLFDHFEDATFQLRANYVAHLRNLVTESAGMKSFAKSDGVPILSHFLEYIFSVLSVGNTKSTWNMSQQNWEEIDMDAFDILDPDALSFKLLAAHLYLRALRTVPSLVRTWWSECKNRQLVLSVESFTEKFFSPAIISREVEFVQTADQGAFENMSIRASKNANEVAAAYNIEDAKLEIVFRLPSSFPLRQVEVETGGGSTGGSGSSGGRTAGVNESRWRSWLLATSGVIIAQNGTILDALQLFKKNVSLHFEGVEDCAICYSVIGVIDRQLPNKQCKTCKHLFHASCLYKWLRTSNQSTCPLCRSLW